MFLHNWWRYRPGETPWVTNPYHAINLFEALIWFVLAVLVIARHLRFRKSLTEALYALAFLTFGLTDVREAYSLDSWLIWFKLANLIVLFRLCASVMRSHYPESRLF